MDQNSNAGDGSAGEGGHMSSTGGSVVLTPDEPMPFKVVLTHDGATSTEHAFETMRECEEFIKQHTPLPAARSTLHDHRPDEA